MRKFVKILLVLALSFSFASAWDIHEDFNVGDQFLMKKSWTAYVITITEVNEKFAVGEAVRVKKNGKKKFYVYTFTKNESRDGKAFYHVEERELSKEYSWPYELLKINDTTFQPSGFTVDTGKLVFYKNKILTKI